MHDIIWVVIGLLVVGLSLLLEKNIEGFLTVDTRDADVNKHVSKIYQDILERYPSSLELAEHRRAILAGKRTFDDVRQRLTDSTEYGTKVKLQSNTLTPELPRMISDSKLLRRLAMIYKEERGGKDIPPRMVLPIKSIFIKLNYNEVALRYMLRSEKWAAMEEDILLSDNFSDDKLDALINHHFGGIDKIIEAAEEGLDPSGANVNDKIDRMIADEDSDMSKLLDDINANGYQVFDKDVAAMCSCSSGTGDCLVHKEIPVRPHYGNMVLRPEFAWNVPHQRPPVCTTLGKPSLVQPVVLGSSVAINGTPLGDAADTGIGSIMPKFTYKEYIDVQVKGKCNSSKPTSSTKST